MRLYERMSMACIGFLYLITGFIIFTWPQLLYYGVAAVFFIHGIVTIARVILQRKEKKITKNKITK